eukprot:Hpha_TRINITY_DN34316_c0_g1::TRINITY_DN34316_c0_g1_i1::g.109564::m.109564
MSCRVVLLAGALLSSDAFGISDEEEHALREMGQTAKEAVLTVFDELESLADTVATFYETNDTLPAYPGGHKYLLSKMQSTVTVPGVVTAVYFGDEEGRMTGFEVAGFGTPQRPTLELWVGTPASPRERRCGENANGTHKCDLMPMCKSSDAGCRWCSWHDVQSQSSPELCAGYQPARYSPFPVPWISDAWDLPKEAAEGRSVSNCVASEEQTETAQQGTRLDNASGRWWVPAEWSGQCNIVYDPRGRHWYNAPSAAERRTWWSPPYIYFSKLVGGSAGLTVNRGVYNKNYDNTPWNGGTPTDPNSSPLSGVFGVDVWLAGLDVPLRRFRPSGLSELFLVRVRSNDSTEHSTPLLAATSALREPCIGCDRTDIMTIGSSAFEYNFIFDGISNVSAAAEPPAVPSLVHWLGGAILTVPMQHENGLWLLVV